MCKDSNCLHCSNDYSVCTGCADGFLAVNGLCVACDSKCKTCEKSISLCKECKDLSAILNETIGSCNCPATFGFDVSGICQACKESSCRTCEDDYSVCNECSPGYFLENERCSSCDSPCLECNNTADYCITCIDSSINPQNGSCTCLSSFGLNELGFCQSCKDSNCSQCALDYTICNECKSGFFSTIESCSPCSSPCFECENTESFCISCSDSSISPIDGVCACPWHSGFDEAFNCKSCLTGCLKCSNNYLTCEECSNGYFLSESQCQLCDNTCSNCTESSTNCLYCQDQAAIQSSSPGECNCPDTKGFNNGGICTTCVDMNCESCNDDNDVCDKCITGFFVNDKKKCCDQSCSTCSDGENCESCKDYSSQDLLGTGLCVCDAGYGRDENSNCSPCSANCNSCSKNYTQCDTCADHYFFNGTGCFSCDFSCKACENHPGHCTECWDNADLSDTSCVCPDGYGFDTTNGKCKFCDEKCNACSSNFTLCTDCKEEFGLNLETNQCESCIENCKFCHSDSSSCLECVFGYFYDSFKCSACHLSCFACNGATNQDCTSCGDHGSLKDGVCSCDAGFGFNVTSGACVPCDYKCSNCANNYLVCTDCLQPYGLNLDTNVCESCIDNCLECHKNSLFCDLCANFYYFDQKSCELCSLSCASCDGNSYNCTNCFEGASLVNSSCICDQGTGLDSATGLCQSCSQNCLACTNNFLECSSCEKNYGVDLANPQNCEVCSKNCLECHNDYSVCTTCESGFYNNNGACAPCKNICGNCSAENTCDTCGPNSFGPSESGKCACNKGFGIDDKETCSLCTDTQCSTCSENNKICDTCIENSNQDLSTGFCKCVNGFGYDSEKSQCRQCLSGCSVCKDDYSICETCSDGFFNNQGTCEPCKNICKTCSNSNSCDLCAANSEFVNPGVCKCSEGYGLDSNASCSSCNVNYCSVCSDDNTKCQTCMSFSSYYLGQTACSCDTGYLLSNGKCLPGKLYLTSNDVEGAYFDSVFTSITIYLTSSIDTTVSSSCSNLLSSLSLLGNSPVCSFSSASSIKIQLGVGWSITASNSLTLNSNNILKTSGEYYLTYSLVSVPVTYSVQPYSPTVQISGTNPIVIGCQSTSFTYSSYKSTGISSNSFIYDWNTDLTGFTESTTKDSITIPSLLLSEISSFFLSLTITDIFGSSSTQTLHIIVSNTGALTLSLDSGSTLAILRSQSYSIVATVTDFCNKLGAPTFKWTGKQGSTTINPNYSSSKLLINALSLQASTDPYIFTVTATLKDLTGSASVSVTVSSSSLVLLVNRPSGTITSSVGFSADASGSYDPDNSNTILSFSWSTSPSSILSNVQSTSSKLTIPGDNFQNQGSFTLTVAIYSDVRTSTSTFSYSVVDNVNTVITFTIPTYKVILSQQFKVKTSITSTVGSTIL